MDFANLIYEPKWQQLNVEPPSQPNLSMCDSLKCMIWSFSRYISACFPGDVRGCLLALALHQLCCHNLLSGTSPDTPSGLKRLGPSRRPCSGSWSDAPPLQVCVTFKALCGSFSSLGHQNYSILDGKLLTPTFPS